MTRFAPRVDGIDVAHYQSEHGTEVDWPTVKANCARPDFAVASFKATQGTSSLDPFFADNRHDVAAAGFRWRFGYHWLSAHTDPIRQASWFLAHFIPGDHEGVCLDAEEAGITEPQVVAWCEYVESVTQRPVAVYTGVYVAGGTIWRSPRVFNGKRVRWVAAYEPEIKVRAACEPYGFDGWQPDGGLTGTFPGVTGPVDLDYVDNPIMFDLACSITATPPDPTPVPIMEDDMSKLYRKNGKNAVWLADGTSRTHVANANVVPFLTAKYGSTILLDESVDLATIGGIVASEDPGDV